MKAILGLLWAICFGVVGLYLLVSNQINSKSLIIVFGFALVGGLAVANYDVLKKWKALGFEVETARSAIGEAKDLALAEIGSEVAKHKESIELLIRSGNDLNRALDSQKKIVEGLLERASKLEGSIAKAEEDLGKTKAEVEAARQGANNAFENTRQLALIITRITYLQAETKNEFGTDRAMKAVKKIETDINRMLHAVIPNLQERQKFVADLQSELAK